ncbi:Phosphotransferase enzyme family protein [Nonomuraea solani]|uniref:Phosphotransferase enzyme family protein n=1 Tax=Nonomuraea solani TaxID=1144553 RepID=A0A1H6DSK2_9ACTN|nr:phosphotransferase [Nonomuraea solani]SEG88337.1 Phosphotransferase enzyme family protein [Nonomuraea solani]
MEAMEPSSAGGAVPILVHRPRKPLRLMAGVRLGGGNDGGAVRVGATVRRPVREWTPSVHELLRHLEGKAFDGAPRVLGVDDDGCEILTYLDGDTVGAAQVWPPWTRTEDTLVQVARWLRSYHEVVADFRPSADARWRGGRRWAPGLVIGHNDASPFNAAHQDGRLTGFFDWDFAGPTTVDSDVASVALCWVPLHARHVAASEGFTEFDARPARLRRFLDAYGWTGRPEVIVEDVRAQLRERAALIRRLGPTDTGLFARLLRRGVADDLDQAVRDLDGFS